MEIQPITITSKTSEQLQRQQPVYLKQAVHKIVDQGQTEQTTTYIYDQRGKMVTSFVSKINLLV